MKTIKHFYEILKEKRTEKRMTLREFCRRAGEDPANFSRIERGLKVPPCDEVLERYGKVLELTGESLREFVAQGALSRRDLPKFMTEEELNAKMPAFLRLINDEFPSEEQLREAVKFTREANR